jgi:hypothetical protein
MMSRKYPDATRFRSSPRASGIVWRKFKLKTRNWDYDGVEMIFFEWNVNRIRIFNTVEQSMLEM